MTELDDPEALADAKIVADAFGIHYEPFKQGLIARARRERLQRILLRLLPIVAVCCGIAWFGFAAWKNSKIHVIDMSGAQVSIAELPDLTSVESGKSWCRLTTEEAAIVDLGEMPSANGVITADLVLEDAAKCGIVIRRFTNGNTESVLAVSVAKRFTTGDEEIDLVLAVHSFTPTGSGTSTYIRQVVRTVPAGFLAAGETVSISVVCDERRLSVILRGETMLSEEVPDSRLLWVAASSHERLGMFVHSGSSELRNLTYVEDDTQ